MAFQNEPPNFGRNGEMPAPSRFGRASIYVAIAALAMVLVGTGVALISAYFGAWQMFASILFLGLCLGFAPFVHLAGIIIGVIGLFRAGDSKKLAVIGILLNIGILATSGVSSYLMSALALHTA